MKSRLSWKLLVSTLPPGLTIAEASRRLRRPYWGTLEAIHRYGYEYSDGRRFRWSDSRLARKRGYRFNPLKADWSKSNIALAKRFGVSRERVRIVRRNLGLPFVESRGRKANPTVHQD